MNLISHMIYRVGLVCLVMVCISHSAVCQIPTNCEWHGSTCTDPWQPFTYPVWLTLSTSPPCSVFVNVHGARRCNEIDVQDFGFSVLITSPSGCATMNDINTFIQSGQFAEQAYYETANLSLAAYLSANPGCCNCENGYMERMIITKIGSCYRPMLNYKLPDGTTATQWYDTSVPWSHYEGIILMAGGSEPTITIEKCPGNGCCMRYRMFCIQNGTAIYSDSEWMQYGYCDNDMDEQCTIRFCD